MHELDPEIVWTEARDLADDLAEAGGDEEEAARAIIRFVDAIIPLDVLLPGPLGRMIEFADGPVIERLVEMLVAALKSDPSGGPSGAPRERLAAPSEGPSGPSDGTSAAADAIILVIPVEARRPRGATTPSQRPRYRRTDG